jgi:myo-inositol 2-dehydrogenase/D-chiro-inositol 1-dehydrogenase
MPWICLFLFEHQHRNSQAHLNSALAYILILVSGKTKPAILGHEILAVSKIASACEKSARTGQFVQLQWEPEDIPPH